MEKLVIHERKIVNTSLKSTCLLLYQVIKTGKLLMNYLSNRQNRVKTNGLFGNFQTINTGVPQETILAPLLLTLYISDLLNEMPEGSIFSYGGDTAVISSENIWELSKQ